MVEAFVATALVGIVVGAFSGMLGVGGGTIMVPLFRLVFGLSPVGSTATSLFTIIPTSVSGAVSHVRGGTCSPKVGIALGVGGACTSPIGVWLAQISPGWAVMVAAALVIAYSGTTMLRKALALPRGSGAERATGADQTAQASSASQAERAAQADQTLHDGQIPDPASNSTEPTVSPITKRLLASAVAVGAIAGVASGYVGLGGGFLMVPLLLSVLNMPMKLASGTSLIAVMILATPATIMQCALGNVELLAGIAMACGSVPGAAIGARLTRVIPERALRFMFAAFLIVAAILLVVKEIGLIG